MTSRDGFSLQVPHLQLQSLLTTTRLLRTAQLFILQSYCSSRYRLAEVILTSFFVHSQHTTSHKPVGMLHLTMHRTYSTRLTLSHMATRPGNPLSCATQDLLMRTHLCGSGRNMLYTAVMHGKSFTICLAPKNLTVSLTSHRTRNISPTGASATPM